MALQTYSRIKMLFFGAISMCLISCSALAVTPEQIERSINLSKEYLYNIQKNGNWEMVPAPTPTTSPNDPGRAWSGQFGGKTAIAVYALLAAGDNPQDPRLAKAIEFLRKTEMVGTYAIAIRAQVWNSLPKTTQNRELLERDAKLLLGLVRSKPPANGFYSYVKVGQDLDEPNRYDHSCSQIGVLGAWACADNVAKLPPEYWALVDRAWRGDQLPEGAWCYYKQPAPKTPATIAMTCGGVATLFITQDFLNRGQPAQIRGNMRDSNIDAGMRWITEHFDSFADEPSYACYSLYGLERVAMASGYKYFGTINWYDRGAEFLLKYHNPNGWYGSVEDTAFGILFLVRGRAPITMNKLEYSIKGKPAHWNQRPRDLASLTRYISTQSERDLKWQIVNLQAPVEELHDAPILYLCGDQPLDLTTEEKQKLKQFIAQGGLLLAHADAGNARFSGSVRALGSALFPDYEFRMLPKNHPIFELQEFPAAKWKRRINVLGLSNGVRELMLLVPDADPARFWQPQDWKGHPDEFQLGADIFLYAVDKKNLLRKGETSLVTPDPNIEPKQKLVVGRIRYKGNWDPEPAGWVRLAAIMRNRHQIDLVVTPVSLGDGHLKECSIAHLTGTSQLKLDSAAQSELKHFVAGGGALIVDAAGGNAQFAISAQAELETIFGADAKSLDTPLPADNPIYKVDDAPIPIEWRDYAKTIVGATKGGRLRAITINDRLAVLFSAEDLSAGLVGQSVNGVIGYEPSTATALMSNILMRSSEQARGIKPN